jgi:N-sulfoglucosamine sulfohydrolase
MVSEIDSAGPIVQQAYETWRKPPEYELYDLQEDPLEFNNLSDDPAYDEIMAGLIQALEDWQRETKDPLADPLKLARYTREVDSVYEKYGTAYAKDPEFEWKYPDYFFEKSKN